MPETSSSMITVAPFYIRYIINLKFKNCTDTGTDGIFQKHQNRSRQYTYNVDTEEK